MYFLCTLLHSTIGGGIPWTGHTSFTSSPVLATTDTIFSSFTGGPLDSLLGNFPRDIWVMVHSRRISDMLIHFWQLTNALSFAFKFDLYYIIICKVLHLKLFKVFSHVARVVLSPTVERWLTLWWRKETRLQFWLDPADQETFLWQQLLKPQQQCGEKESKTKIY